MNVLFLLWVMHLFTLLYEWEKKSLAMVFWAMLLVVFTLPHTVHIIYAKDYSEHITNQATAFAILFIGLYLFVRFIYFRSDKGFCLSLDIEEIRNIPESQLNFFFITYLISFCIIIVGFYGNGFSILSTTWTETLYSESTIFQYLAKMIIISFSGLGFIFFFRKGVFNKLRFIIVLVIFVLYFIMSKSRYNLLGFVTPFMIYYLFNKDRKKVILGIICGIVFVFLVFFLQQARWAGSISEAISTGPVELFGRSIRYMSEGNGELGLIKAYYYFIENNNNFPMFGEGNGYVRLALLIFPSSIMWFKPRDFAIDMYREWFHLDLSRGTMHPTLFGDVYANFGFKGVAMGGFYAILICFIDENVNKTPQLMIKVFKVSLACTMFVMIGRGAVYNSIFNFIFGWICVSIVYMLYLIMTKLFHHIRY